MPSHQAEKDAIDTLVLLRSPHSATFAKHDYGSGSAYGQGHDRMGSVGGTIGTIGMGDGGGGIGTGIGIAGSAASTALSSPMVAGFAAVGERQGVSGSGV